VTPQCNRVAVRLSGPVVRPEIERELPSEGLVLGAVQVPADGQPLVFLADHPTTGGYPVIGVVVGEDVAGCAQLAPGDRVQFRPAP
jgi:allophanate hydrolase subunit 2